MKNMFRFASSALFATGLSIQLMEGNTLMFSGESAYNLEGRDMLDGEPFFSASYETNWRNLSGSVWTGWSPGPDYREEQYGLGWSESYGAFEWSVGFTHLRFLTEHNDDQEWGVSGTWTEIPGNLELMIDGYYSLDAAGWFGELSLSKALHDSEQTTVAAELVFGVNQGYIADGHDGANHIALNLGSEYSFHASARIEFWIAYTWAINRNPALPGDTQLKDFMYSGAALSWSF